MVIAIIGILIANLIPTLGAVRKKTNDLQNLSNLRQHAAVFQAYLTDWQDTYPAITDRKASYTIVRHRDLTFALRYFDAGVFWPVALADDYYNSSAWSGVFLAPGREQFGPTYRYSHTFLATSRYWDLTTREGPHQWAAVKAGEVDFPSRKGLLVDLDQTRIPDPNNPGLTMVDLRSANAPISVAYCDGSAADHKKSEISSPVPQGEGPWLAFNELGQSTRFGTPVMHTFNGSRGTDR